MLKEENVNLYIYIYISKTSFTLECDFLKYNVNDLSEGSRFSRKLLAMNVTLVATYGNVTITINNNGDLPH